MNFPLCPSLCRPWLLTGLHNLQILFACLVCRNSLQGTRSSSTGCRVISHAGLYVSTSSIPRNLLSTRTRRLTVLQTLVTQPSPFVPGGHQIVLGTQLDFLSLLHSVLEVYWQWQEYGTIHESKSLFTPETLSGRPKKTRILILGHFSDIRRFRNMDWRDLFWSTHQQRRRQNRRFRLISKRTAAANAIRGSSLLQ
jgi:hypothetical protein